MKKTILSLVLLLVAISVQAQYQRGDTFIYPRLGISVANMSGNDIYVDISRTGVDQLHSKGKSGLTAGLELETFAARQLSLSIGAFYANAGCRYDDFGYVDTQNAIYENTENYKWNVHLLSVPLLANYYVTEHVALKLGIEGNYLLSAKSTSDFTRGHMEDISKYIPEEQHSDSEDITSAFHKASFSIPIGASVEYKHVVLDARYYLGITKATKIYDSRHRWFSITLGYQIEL